MSLNPKNRSCVVSEEQVALCVDPQIIRRVRFAGIEKLKESHGRYQIFRRRQAAPDRERKIEEKVRAEYAVDRVDHPDKRLLRQGPYIEEIKLRIKRTLLDGHSYPP